MQSPTVTEIDRKNLYSPLSGLGMPRQETDRLGAMPQRPARQVLTTRVGLQFPDGLTFDGWERAGHQISRVADSFAWYMGDWLVYGQKHYSDRYRRAVEVVGLDYQTLRNYASVARRVTVPRRRPKLSFQHHAEVASLPPEDQVKWLEKAERLGWSRNQLRLCLREYRNGGKPSSAVSIPLPKVAVSNDRMAKWRAAAAQSSSMLESWIVKTLDSAAEQTLGAEQALEQTLDQAS